MEYVINSSCTEVTHMLQHNHVYQVIQLGETKNTVKAQHKSDYVMSII